MSLADQTARTVVLSVVIVPVIIAVSPLVMALA
jgi:hypothetical protein